jgi:toxin YoeB
MVKQFSDSAWDDFIYWMNDKRTLNKIQSLLKDIERNGNDGIGKPEALKHGLTGYWSRRITDVDRLIYKIDEDLNLIYIISCRGHYDVL